MENKENTHNENTLVIDAGNAVLGRLASFAAKQALLGKKVIVVNCNNALVTGRRRMSIEEYKISRQRGGASLNGPNFPKQPFRVMERTIRGMLRFRHGRGKDAFGKILCFDDCPKEYSHMKKHSMERQVNTQSITLSDLAKEL